MNCRPDAFAVGKPNRWAEPPGVAEIREIGPLVSGFERVDHYIEIVGLVGAPGMMPLEGNRFAVRRPRRPDSDKGFRSVGDAALVVAARRKFGYVDVFST